jgi:hypothetical protein
MWARIGYHPRMMRDQRLVQTYSFGTIWPDRAFGSVMIMPHGTTEAINKPLVEVSAAAPEGCSHRARLRWKRSTVNGYSPAKAEKDDRSPRRNPAGIAVVSVVMLRARPPW